MRRLALSLLALALILGTTATAQADFAYGYAEQTISGLTMTTAVINGTQTGNSTTASATIKGSGTSTNDPLDTLQAYQGASPPAPQNDYTKYSTAGGGPQAGDFTRGDALITGAGNLFLPAGASASNVAESFVSTAGTGPGLLTGSGSWTLSGTFTTTATAVTLSYNYANDIVAQVSGNGQASASFKVTFSIKDQHGHEVNSSPNELSTALSSLPNGPEIISSGSSSATLSLAGLTSGDIYTLSTTGTELSAVTLFAPVPEPSSIAMLGVGLAGFAAVARRRRSGRSRAM